MKKTILLAALFSAAFTVTACDTLKTQLGLTRREPDEFAVMRRAPLDVPADVNQANLASLPVPQPGAPRPQETAPQAEAELAILGAPSTQAARPGLSQGEADLLSRAGAVQSDPNIRATVNREATTEAKDNRPVAKRLLNIGKEHTSATVVDAKAEAQRLKENRQKGAPVTRGETPSIDD